MSCGTIHFFSSKICADSENGLLLKLSSVARTNQVQYLMANHQVT